MNFYTLFDSNYIDRALVMYDSLVSVCEDATIYVVAFDKACYDALSELSLPHMVAIPYDEFEDDVLRDLKANRSRREYLWTCSGYSIRYIMKRFDLPHLTYIDSDLCFYDSPVQAVERFLQSTNDAAIISHRFSDHPENRYNARMYGTYCVQFNTFKNTENGKRILNWWIDRCIESCPGDAVDGLFGDQKYLDSFAELFDGVYEYEDFGFGVAPWNVDDFVLYDDEPNRDGIHDNNSILIKNRHTGASGQIIFYHFHSLDVFEDGGSNIRVFIRPGRHDSALVEKLYIPYMRALIKKRRYLQKRFGLFSKVENGSGDKIHEGELRQFLTCEPSLWFLVRKIIRYALYKKKDYMRYE